MPSTLNPQPLSPKHVPINPNLYSQQQVNVPLLFVGLGANLLGSFSVAAPGYGQRAPYTNHQGFRIGSLGFTVEAKKLETQ